MWCMGGGEREHKRENAFETHLKPLKFVRVRTERASAMQELRTEVCGILKDYQC